MTEVLKSSYGYTPKSHPKLFKQHGDAYMNDRVAPFIDRVASRIAVMQMGEKCEYIEISQKSTPLCVKVFADFSDGVRMWVREDDFDNPRFDRWRERELVDHQPQPWGS